MKKIIFCLLLLPVISSADYVKGDGNLDLICRDKNTASQPYNIFDLTLMYDDSTGKGGLDLISDSNLGSGNGDIVYQVKATQFPTYDSEIFPALQEVKGCEFAPLTVTMSKDSDNFELYFECDADGDAGYGHLVMNAESGKVEGKINFPEGKDQLQYPIFEDTELEVTCDYKNL